MPRDLPLSNGSLYVAFDAQHRLRELYYPHVGMENHVLGHVCRIGAWVGGKFSWVGDEGWTLSNKYAKDTLVTEVTATNAELELELAFREAVDFHLDVFLRGVRVGNLANAAREIRLFFTQDFYISGNEVGDTAYYDPNSKGVIHYKARRWFL